MISMTWPQYKRSECQVSGEFIVSLSPLETEILSTLLLRYPEPVSVNDLIEAVYLDADTEPDWAESTIYQALRHIAHKVGTFRIATHRGIGFRVVQAAGDLRRRH